MYFDKSFLIVFLCLLYCILYNLKLKNMLLNYLLIPATLFSLLYVIVEIKKLYKEIYYIRKDIETFVDEKIQGIIYDEIDEIITIKKEDNL